MEKNYLIRLTNSLYRLTLLFPKKDPLRYKMRELSVDILANFLKNNPSQKGEELSFKIRKDLEVLNSFFELALSQNWVSPSQLLVVKEDYEALEEQFKMSKIENEPKEEEEVNDEPVLLNQKSEIKEEVIITSPPVPEKEKQEIDFDPAKDKKLNDRQRKIIEFLKENGRAQVWQIKEIMPDVAKRTLRRDFEYMVEQRIIKRIGERNDTFYQIRKN